MNGHKLQQGFPDSLTRHLISSLKDSTIFIYADCLSGYLYHEQTKIFDQQPNCFGIPVCWCFDRHDDLNYFTDDQSYMFEGLITKEMEAAQGFKSVGHTYWVQSDLGRTYMEKQCPRLFEFLQKQLSMLI